MGDGVVGVAAGLGVGPSVLDTISARAADTTAIPSGVGDGVGATVVVGSFVGVGSTCSPPLVNVIGTM